MMDDETKAILRAINTNLRNIDATMRETHGLRARPVAGRALAAPVPMVAPGGGRQPPQTIQSGAVSMAVHQPGGGGSGPPVASVSFDIGTPPGAPPMSVPEVADVGDDELAASA